MPKPNLPATSLTHLLQAHAASCHELVQQRCRRPLPPAPQLRRLLFLLRKPQPPGAAVEKELLCDIAACQHLCGVFVWWGQRGRERGFERVPRCVRKCLNNSAQQHMLLAIAVLGSSPQHSTHTCAGGAPATTPLMNAHPTPTSPPPHTTSLHNVSANNTHTHLCRRRASHALYERQVHLIPTPPHQHSTLHTTQTTQTRPTTHKPVQVVHQPPPL